MANCFFNVPILSVIPLGIILTPAERYGYGASLRTGRSRGVHWQPTAITVVQTAERIWYQWSHLKLLLGHFVVTFQCWGKSKSSRANRMLKRSVFFSPRHDSFATPRLVKDGRRVNLKKSGGFCLPGSKLANGDSFGMWPENHAKPIAACSNLKKDGKVYRILQSQ